MSSIDIPLVGGWHVTLFGGAFVLLGTAVLIAAIAVVLIKR